MARFNETVNLQQVRSSTGAATTAMSLAESLQEFSNMAGRIHQQDVISRETARGAEAGAKAAAGDQSIVMKEKSFFGGVGRQAYNDALGAAYIAGVTKDNAEHIQRLSLEYERNLKGFNDAVNAHIAGVAKTVDPSISGLAKDTLEGMANGYRKKIIQNEHKITLQNSYVEADAGVDAVRNVALDFARGLDQEAMDEQLLIHQGLLMAQVNSGQKTAEQARADYDALVQDTEKAQLSGLIDQEVDLNGLDAGYDKLIELEKQRPANVEPADWDNFLSQEQTRLDRKRRLLERDEAEKLKAAKKALDFSNVERRVAGDDVPIMEPKIVDAYFSEVYLPDLVKSVANEEQVIAGVAHYVDRVKMLPPSLKSQIENDIGSRNPELIAQSVRLLDRIDEIPGVVEAIPKDQRAYAEKVVQLAQNMEPNEAVKLAAEATNPKDKARIEAVKMAIKAQFQGKNKQEYYRDQAVKSLPGFFSPAVDEVSGDQMGREWGASYEAYRESGLDEGKSAERANKIIARNWGEFEGRTMKYPPNNFYEADVDGSYEWIFQQLVSDINKDSFQPVPRESIYLMANDVTARTAAVGQPSYAVRILTEDGFFTYPRNWAPDVEAENAKRKARTISEAEALRRSKMIGLSEEDKKRLGRIN